MLDSICDSTRLQELQSAVLTNGMTMSASLTSEVARIGKSPSQILEELQDLSDRATSLIENFNWEDHRRASLSLVNACQKMSTYLKEALNFIAKANPEVKLGNLIERINEYEAFLAKPRCYGVAWHPTGVQSSKGNSKINPWIIVSVILLLILLFVICQKKKH